jgi:hypothetical protein
MIGYPFTINMSAYVGVLFPKEITGHLSLFAARALTNELASNFIGSELTVQVTGGEGFLPLELRITEFKPKSVNFYVPIIKVCDNQLVRQFRLAMPLALQPEEFNRAAKSWGKQLAQMIQNEGSLLRGKMSGVSDKIAIVIFRYYDSTRMSRSVRIKRTF